MFCWPWDCPKWQKVFPCFSQNFSKLIWTWPPLLNLKFLSSRAAPTTVKTHWTNPKPVYRMQQSSVFSGLGCWSIFPFIFPLGVNSSLNSYKPWTKPTSSNQYPMEKKNGNLHSKPDCCILFNIKLELRETDSSKWMLRYMMLNAKFSQMKLFRGTYDNYHGTEIIWWSILFLKYLEILE